MSDGTKYITKEALLTAIKKLVAYNTSFATSSDDIQTAANNIVESLWPDGSGGDPGLQEVLDVSSVASVLEAISIASNNGYLTLNGDSMGYSYFGATLTGLSVNPSSSILEGNAGAGVSHNLSASNNGLTFFGNPSNTAEATALSVISGGIKAANGQYTIKSVGVNGGVSPVSSNSAFSPEATWDVDGTLKVGTRGDGSADTKMLTVDVDGNVREKDITDVEMKDRAADFTPDGSDGGNTYVIFTGGSAVNVTIDNGLCDIVGERVRFINTANNEISFTANIGANLINPVPGLTLAATGELCWIERLNDNYNGLVGESYIITR